MKRILIGLATITSGWRFVSITIFAALVLALGLAACGGDDDGETPATVPSEESNEATTTSLEDAAALEGTWRTSPITVDELTKALREQGLAEWVARFNQNSPVSDIPMALVLDIRNGRWDLYGEPPGGPREKIDYDAQFGVDGDTVVVSHEADFNTYRWSVEGEVLELTWLETTYPSFKGIPEEVFQRALYMTADFRRAD